MSSFNSTVSQAEHLSAYGYVPHTGVAILYLALFGISTLLHAVQAVYFRTWWMFPTAFLCGIGELIGWSGRLWSSFFSTGRRPLHDAVITTTIIAPTPLIAVNFILLSRIVARLGPCYSRLTPRLYTRIFLTCDIIALIVQGGGGGIAASSHKIKTINLGGNIMLGGIIFQFVALTAYTALGADFLRHYASATPVRAQISGSERGVLDSRLRLMISALSFSTLVLFARSIYRMAELADGWTGRIITTEVYFNVFDAGMVTLAIFTMNIAHPGMLLGSPKDETKRKLMMMKQISSGSQESLV
ncbi:RTA1-like protein [Mycena venus]|uniref:RTA1-like protein n=1 Tax=Mycena venus TaxID=2733690 RepID=A0A8H6U0V5_9AGAR|nr:RTA1-like protein [Mycena venus]